MVLRVLVSKLRIFYCLMLYHCILPITRHSCCLPLSLRRTSCLAVANTRFSPHDQLNAVIIPIIHSVIPVEFLVAHLFVYYTFSLH